MEKKKRNKHLVVKKSRTTNLSVHRRHQLIKTVVMMKQINRIQQAMEHVIRQKKESASVVIRDHQELKTKQKKKVHFKQFVI